MKTRRTEEERAQHAAQILPTLPPGSTIEQALKIADEVFEMTENFIKRRQKQYDIFAIKARNTGGNYA